MRVAYVITDLHIGGVPLHLLRLAGAVGERGPAPSVISLAPLGAVAERLRELGIATLTCEAAGPRDIGAIRRLAQHLRRLQPDIVHSFLFHANVASCLAVRLAGRSARRLICEIQTAEVERRWHLVVGGMTHRLSSCLVGNSPSVVAHLRRHAHVAPKRLRCVPGGVDMARLTAAAPVDRAELGVAAGRAVVMWVGRFDPVKGLDELIDAFGRVAGSRDAVLVLVGEGAYEGAVRRRVARCGLGERVLMLGRRDDVPNLLKLADVFVLPSRTEGMPNALLEAMAVGRAVVTTDVPGCRDLVTHERTGLLVSPGDGSQLASAIERLLADRPLADRLAGAASAHVRAHYTFRGCVDRYLALYREVGSASLFSRG